MSSTTFVVAVFLSAIPLAAQCPPFSISPSSASFLATGGTGQIAITGTSGCARTATSNVPWVTISFGQEGTGSGSAGYTVLPNPTPMQRTGTLTVAGQTFTITQAAAVCTYSVSPMTVTLSSSGGSGSFQVTANCTWTATTNASWITIVGGAGTSDGTVGYVAAANPGPAQRSGTITIGSATFTLTQSAPCNFTFASSGTLVAAAGGSFTVQVTASANSCERNATSNVTWITIGTGGTGSGSGAIGYTVAANTSTASRLGSIRVGEQTFVISQEGSTCLYTLTPAQRTMPVNGGSGTFTVTTGTACTWTAASTVDWVLVTAGASGTGNGTVTYGVAANNRNEPRTTTITVGNTAFFVSQPAAGCDIAIDPESATIPTEGGTGLIQVIAPLACSWTATKNADWVTLTPPVSGAGDGVVRYSATANTSIQTRRAIITIAGKIVQLVQAPANCNVSIASASIQIPATGGTGNVQITANCQWQATVNVAWIQLTSPPSGSSDAMLAFSVQPNTGASLRTGNIVINGQTVVVTQQSQTCTLTVTPAVLTLPARGGSGSANVSGGSSCSWSASTNDRWLETNWSSVNGSGGVNATAGPNTSGSERVATITVGNQAISVRQPAITIRITAESVVNAASFRTGAVAAGEIVTIFGSGFGPAALKTLELATDRQSITKAIGDSRVLFDGVEAPMVYTLDGQLSAIVPYAVSGKTATLMQVEYLGVLSNTLPLSVAPASPAIFTAESSGTGAGAILNQDFALNTAATPAARGSVVQIFATGEGQTSPGGIDGKLAVQPLPAPLLPVTVTIGGRPATVTYAGAAPGLVAGVIQINARVSDDITPGPAVPVVIRVGEFASRDGVTLSVR